MKKTLYLYNLKPSSFDDLLYFDALRLKKKAGEALFRDLFFKHNKTEEEDARLFHVRKANEHTQKLLDERYD